jgi:hypothetical protein
MVTKKDIKPITTEGLILSKLENLKIGEYIDFEYNLGKNVSHVVSKHLKSRGIFSRRRVGDFYRVFRVD